MIWTFLIWVLSFKTLWINAKHKQVLLLLSNLKKFSEFWSISEAETCHSNCSILMVTSWLFEFYQQFLPCLRRMSERELQCQQSNQIANHFVWLKPISRSAATSRGSFLISCLSETIFTSWFIQSIINYEN